MDIYKKCTYEDVELCVKMPPALECFPMYRLDSFLVILAFRHPHLLECIQGSKDGATGTKTMSQLKPRNIYFQLPVNIDLFFLSLHCFDGYYKHKKIWSNKYILIIFMSITI